MTPLTILHVTKLTSVLLPAQTIREFIVIGRKEATAADPTPQLYRMQIFAANEVTARSRFWYVLHQTKKMKRTTGEILSVNEIFEENPNTVKNFAVWLRYNSRSGTHNMYKEFRDITLCGAIEQMYADMSGRHRARKSSIQIIKTATVKAADTKRDPIKMMHDSKIKFPLTHVRPRASHKRLRSTFVAHRPTTFVG